VVSRAKRAAFAVKPVQPTPTSIEWRPTGTIDSLRLRAIALKTVRDFFELRDVVEVETPALVNAPVSDVHLTSLLATLSTGGANTPLFLHTSPEYAMKRLLAAGSGDIYQICKVFRADERSRLHNPEFTMVEWYRLGWSLESLMSEVAALVLQLLGPAGAERSVEYVSYQEAVQRALDIDPLEAPVGELQSLAARHGFSAVQATRDELLDFIVGAVVGPSLGRNALTFLHRYPASQAALARLDPDDPRVALRFELYADGIELANGFDELANAADQRVRFTADQAERQRRGLTTFPLDERFLAALAHGLPACSGVALGLDRVLMLAQRAARIDEVLSFPTERA
jgi:elongation factor P--(R)-beta-lysine ligase